MKKRLPKPQSRILLPISAIASLILLCGGCSKVSDNAVELSSTNRSDAAISAQSQGDEQNSAPEGVVSGAGTKPFTWPKPLAALPFDKRVRYRDSDCSAAALSENILGDKETFIHVTRGEELIGRIWLSGRGQFRILDVGTPLPVMESWGQRHDGLFCRSLLVPMRDGGRLHYGGCYTEVYTPDKNRAALPEPCEVQLQPEAKITKVYFLGRLETATVADAEQRLKEAQAIQ